MRDDNLIVTVNGPVIEGHMLQPQASGVIYSVSLANGMVVTSPETFEAVTNVIGHKYGRRDKPQDNQSSSFHPSES